VRTKTIFAVVTVVSLLAIPFLAQQEPAPVPGVIRINVNLVQVDAVVTDNKGKPVTDLKAEDFEVLQDGQVQKIRNFEFVSVDPSTPSRSSRIVSSTASTANLPAPTLHPEDVRRTIAIVIDDIALSFDGVMGVKNALKKWVDTQMRPGDVVSIVRTNAAVGAFQQFTNDKRILDSAIERIKFQPGRVGVESFTPFMGADQAALLPDDRGFPTELRSAYIIGSLNAIRYVMRGLRDLPGRKSLILFSEDLGLPDVDSAANLRMGQEERMKSLADEANRASVVFYAIDPRGSYYTGPTASDNLKGYDDATVASMINRRNQEAIRGQDSMIMLAQKTGGLFISGTNDLAADLHRASDDGDGYYLMGYQPEKKTFNEKADAYHTISVRLKRPGLKVRSRSGFFGTEDGRNTLPSVPRSPEAALAKALVSPFVAADLHVRLTALVTHNEKKESFIQTLLYIDGNDLTFKEEADGSQRADLDLGLTTVDENGKPQETTFKSWNIKIDKERMQRVLQKGFVYSGMIPIKRSGPYQMRIAVRDAGSQKLGSAMQFLDIPNISNGRLSLSGIALAAASLSADDPDGTPAVRIFKPGETITYAYQILNSETAQQKTQVDTQVRLFRGTELIYEGPTSPANLTPDSSNRLAVSGRLRLNKVTAGDYILQIAVIDNLRKDKNRIATQTIDFEVRN
jgi:VWFA-related protein